MSIPSVGLYWSDQKGWTITCDEGTSTTRGLIKAIKVVIGKADLSDRKNIGPIPLEDALGSALGKTEGSIVFVRSTHVTFTIQSDLFLTLFEHKGGRTAMVGTEEVHLDGCEFVMVGMILEKEDFDLSDTEKSQISSRSSTRSRQSDKSVKPRSRNCRGQRSTKTRKFLNYVVFS